MYWILWDNSAFISLSAALLATGHEPRLEFRNLKWTFGGTLTQVNIRQYMNAISVCSVSRSTINNGYPPVAEHPPAFCSATPPHHVVPATMCRPTRHSSAVLEKHSPRGRAGARAGGRTGGRAGARAARRRRCVRVRVARPRAVPATQRAPWRRQAGGRAAQWFSLSCAPNEENDAHGVVSPYLRETCP